MPKINLQKQNKELECAQGETILSALRREGVELSSSCGGHATCGECVVKILKGRENISPQEFPELRLLGNIFHITKERLSCQTKVLGDVEIEL